MTNMTKNLIAYTLVALASPALAEVKTFSHKRHLEEGAECTTCHLVKETPPKLAPQACDDCHEGSKPAYSLPAKARPLKIQFPHAAHAEAVECKGCHAATADERQPAGQPLMGQDRCTSCHHERKVTVTTCTACHGVDARREEPSDHGLAWLRNHGEESRFRRNSEHGRDCELCHRGATCETCHRTTAPANHTGLWRVRTHGLAAEWDREACKTCHESGACIRCHRSTEPLSHKGAWQATHGLAAETRSNEHCAVCHPLSWCAACHRGRK